jgi:endonuclease/exonuclease/phosphatase (EEP) superfamily protein YafD
VYGAAVTDPARRFALEKLQRAARLVYVALLYSALVAAVTSKLSMIAFLQSGVHWAMLAGLAGAVGSVVGAVGSALHWSFDLMAQLLLPAAAVAFLIVPVAAFLRRPAVAGGAAAVALAAMALAMPSMKAPGPVPSEAPRFKVLLFNVWYSNSRAADVARLIARENPDLVVLLELSGRTRKVLKPVVDTYPYKFDCAGAGCDGLVFSRARLLPQAVHRTSDPDRSPYAMIATDIAGCRMTLVTTHMTRPFPNRPYWAQRAQAEEIGSAVGLIPGAKLVLGDFNAAPWGYVIRTIEQRGKVRVLTGPGGTWPTMLPSQLRIPIDHILASDGLSFVSRTVLPSTGSDHAPVLAEVAVTDRGQCR